MAIGIADGVGGWKQYGVDPSLFPGILMKNCERYAKDYCIDCGSPKKILQAGYDDLISENPHLLGVFFRLDIILKYSTSTICLKFGEIIFLIEITR